MIPNVRPLQIYGRTVARRDWVLYESGVDHYPTWARVDNPDVHDGYIAVMTLGKRKLVDAGAVIDWITRLDEEIGHQPRTPST